MDFAAVWLPLWAAFRTVYFIDRASWSNRQRSSYFITNHLLWLHRPQGALPSKREFYGWMSGIPLTQPGQEKQQCYFLNMTTTLIIQASITLVNEEVDSIRKQSQELLFSKLNQHMFINQWSEKLNIIKNAISLLCFCSNHFSYSSKWWLYRYSPVQFNYNPNHHHLN